MRPDLEDQKSQKTSTSPHLLFNFESGHTHLSLSKLASEPDVW